MPRKYTRKTGMGLVPHQGMLEAVKDVVELGKSIRKAAEEKGVSKSVLQRYVKKYQQCASADLAPNYTHKLVFNPEQERSLAEYLKVTSKMFHGLTPLKTRQLAFQMADKNGLSMPENWLENKMTGVDWLRAFMTRHSSLAIRSPEATSLARATAFNKHTVGEFFNLLEQQIKTTNVIGNRIYNLDETGMTTVQKVPKVISTKGMKQVGQVTSRERGELVTVCAIVSASGVAIPPVFVFPRKNFREVFLTGAPEGSLGLAADSGWMNSQLFVSVIKHVVQWTNSSKDLPIILILDNHQSHLSVETLEFAKDHGVNIITLPPHTSHKTQPLDRSVFGPMKAYFNSETNSWMMKNPGKTITIYQMVQLIGASWLKAASPNNIISGFQATGIWPFDRHAFSDDEFLPSSLTDRPEPTNPVNQVDPGEGTSDEGHGSVVADVTPHDPPIHENTFLTPEKILGYPKAPERKTNNTRGRNKGKTMIATSTPELKRIRNVADDKRQKALEKSRKDNIKAKKQLNLNRDDSSSSEEEVEMELVETDEDLDDSDTEDELLIGTVNLSEVKAECYVLVEFLNSDKPGRHAPVYYVGKVINEANENGDLDIDFLRKSQKVQNKFVRPYVAEVAQISQDQVKAVFPKPLSTGTTSRTKEGIVFPVQFGRIDIR